MYKDPLSIYNAVQFQEKESFSPILTVWKDKQGYAEALIVAIFIQCYLLFRQAKTKSFCVLRELKKY